jgi:hypothetical protein
MTTRRMIWFSVTFLGVTGLAMALSGCGEGAKETLPTGEVKIAPPDNPKPGVGPVSEEYKNMAPGAGKTKQ